LPLAAAEGGTCNGRKSKGYWWMWIFSPRPCDRRTGMRLTISSSSSLFMVESSERNERPGILEYVIGISTRCRVRLIALVKPFLLANPHLLFSVLDGHTANMSSRKLDTFSIELSSSTSTPVVDDDYRPVSLRKWYHNIPLAGTVNRTSGINSLCLYWD